MTAPTPWETIGHRVAIGGTVRDDAGQPSAGACVALRAAGKGDDAESAAAVSAAVGPTCATRRDGSFFFVDLAPGSYRLTARDTHGATAETTVKVTRQKDGRIAFTQAHLVVKKNRRAGPEDAPGAKHLR